MSGNENLDIFRRWIITVIFGGVAALSLVLSCVSLFRGEGQDALVMLVLGLFCVLVVLTFLFQRPIVDMDEKGVYVQILVKRQFYPWKSLKQAGIVSKMEKFKFHSRIVLVTEKGSPRGEDDNLFMIRNLGRAIQLPGYSWMMKEYVEKHYGPLDFNDTAR